ncbi:hypothetical protein OAK97_00470 [bacterium]|nr:hypothetical protein [bacterium]
MSQLDQLITNYQRHIELTHSLSLPTAQRIWFAVYSPEDERRLQVKLGEFELATLDAGYLWRTIDLRGQLTAWFQSVDPDELPAWFQYPGDIETYSKTQFQRRLVNFIRAEMEKAPEPDRTVFALVGLMELFDYRHLSDILAELEKSFPGFLLVFFPGEREENTYRFLNARDGWDYLATPIQAEH